MSMLAQVCPLAVPKCYVRLKGEGVDGYLGRWGFQRVEVADKQTKQLRQEWEDVEVFLRRVTAHVQLYAAFLQNDKQCVHGIEHGWQYMSRHAPPTSQRFKVGTATIAGSGGMIS